MARPRDTFLWGGSSRSPSSALLHFVGGRAPLLKINHRKQGRYPYSNLSNLEDLASFLFEAMGRVVLEPSFLEPLSWGAKLFCRALGQGGLGND